MQHSPSVLWKVFFFSLIHQPLNYVMLCALLIWFILQIQKEKEKKSVTDSLMTLIMFLYPDTMLSILDSLNCF